MRNVELGMRNIDPLRPRRPDLFPIFKAQSGDAAELADVMGDEREVRHAPRIRPAAHASGVDH